MDPLQLRRLKRQGAHFSSVVLFQPEVRLSSRLFLLLIVVIWFRPSIIQVRKQIMKLLSAEECSKLKA